MDTDRYGGESFDALYRDSFAAVEGSARWVVGDAQVACEIAQDAFVAALVHWRNVRRYDNPGAWVRRVAIRQAVRAAQRARDMPSFAATAVTPDPDVTLDVRVAVASLPPAQRAAVVLRYMHDLSVSDVAHTLGCSEGTAKTHLFRARKTLAALLAEDDD